MSRYTRLGLLFVLLIVACVVVQVPTKPSLDDVRRAAYAFAVECAPPSHPNTKQVLKFEEIKWKVYPDTIIVAQINDTTKTFLGLYIPGDSTIWITKPLAYSVWANAHEVMHAIGYHAHPNDPFERCRLMPYQHAVVVP